MSLPIPNLDDRNFDDLMKEAISLIPIYNKEWTNHNPSDPGITLLELFAWLTEMLIYRINQIPRENYQKFLKLIGIELNAGEGIDQGIKRGLESISQRYRAITSDDFEFLAMECIQNIQRHLFGRAICLSNTDLEYSTPEKEKPGHVSIVIIPRCEVESDYCKNYCTEKNLATCLKDEVRDYLGDRRLITTRVHVVGPEYEEVKLEIWISLKENTDEEGVEKEVLTSIKGYFDPITGGPEGSGWPLGRGLYPSELSHLLEGINGVDHVEKIEINDNPSLNILEIEKDQLIALKPDPIISINSYE